MVRYTVKTGDTLFEIAQRFNTTIERILALNPTITDPNNISVGQVILIEEEDTAPVPLPIPIPNGGETYTTKNVNGLVYVLATNQYSYRRGESVLITLVKCNTTNRSITLNYNTSQRVDFVAIRNNREVWRWSRDQFFSQVTGRVTLGPGECQSYSVVWNQRNNAGNQVAADDFVIRGFNVAQGYANQGIDRYIRIESGPIQPTPRPTVPPPSPEPCPQENLLGNNSFETWPDADAAPSRWRGNNLYRTTLSNYGRYAAELGATHNRRATLSQTVDASAGRIYKLEFYARENEQAGGVSNYQLRAEIFFYNRAGDLVGRADPIISEAAVPNNAYQLYTLTTGISPRGTARAEVRFTFIPDPQNDNTLKIDSVTFFCIR